MLTPPDPHLIPSGEEILAWSKEAQRRIDAGDTEPFKGIPFAVLDWVDERQFSHHTVDLTLGKIVTFNRLHTDWHNSNPNKHPDAQPISSVVNGGFLPEDEYDEEVFEEWNLETQGRLVVHPLAIVFPITNEVIHCGIDENGIGWLGKLHDTSTWARRGGSSHANAGFVDVGFRNQLTLEEAPRGWPVKLSLGLVTCQISFHPCKVGSTYPVNGNVYQERIGRAPQPKPHKIYLPKK